MRFRLLAPIVALVALFGVTTATTGVAGAAVGAPRAATATSALTTAVTGTFTDALGGAGTVTGSFTPTRFISQHGTLAVVGTLTTTLTDSLGNVVGTVTRQVTQAVTAAGSCKILHLTLGPLDLNLLGLKVHLDRIVLDITAQSGPGNLLGNLLCAIAHLLDGTGPAGALAALLNRVLAILG